MALTEEQMMQRLPVTESELQDLTTKLREFRDSLTPDQQQVVGTAFDLAMQDAKRQADEGNAVAQQLFGDAETQETLQNFLADKAGTGSDVQGYMTHVGVPTTAVGGHVNVSTWTLVLLSLLADC